MKRARLKIHGAIDDGYVVGHVVDSDYISFSRQYNKNGREPLEFTIVNLDSSNDGSDCTFGRTFLRSHTLTCNAPTAQPTRSDNRLHVLRRVAELVQENQSEVTYNSIKAQIVQEFGVEKFIKHKEIIKFKLSHLYITSTVGLLYRTNDGFIKICRSEHFGGLKVEQFVFFVLDIQHMGYGECIVHNSPIRILFVDSTSRHPWNLEKRLYMGGEGDGMNASYMTCNPLQKEDLDNAQVDHFVITDVHYENNMKTQLLHSQHELNKANDLYSNAQELIACLRQNNGEAENEVEQEHKINRTIRMQMVAQENNHTTALAKQSTELQKYKKQRHLLKNECKRLQQSEKDLQNQVRQMMDLKDVDVAEMNTLRKQLAHQRTVSKKATSLEDSAPPLPPRDQTLPIPTSSSMSNAKSKKNLKASLKTQRLAMQDHAAGQVLNLRSEVSFLSAEVKALEIANMDLKREKEDNDMLVKELGGKLHALVVENEKLKSNF